jgi:hypothetical protein
MGEVYAVSANAKRLLKKALAQKTPMGLFLNRYGEQKMVILDENREGLATLGSPSFQICMVLNGILTDNSGDPIHIDALPEAIRGAEEERIRFYNERESAWPSGRHIPSPHVKA